MSETTHTPEGPAFAERPTEFAIREAFVLGALPLALAGPLGPQALRIGIFLAMLDVHVNRCPLAGRVVSIARSGSHHRAALDRYGYIRFGSRTDVLLPPRALPEVRRGDRLRGGSAAVAHLEERA